MPQDTDQALCQTISDVLTWDGEQQPDLVIQLDASVDPGDEFEGQASFALAGDGERMQAGLTPEKVDELIEALQAVKAFYARHAARSA